MSQIEPKRCTLRLAMGVIEACPGERCAFWEPGGAVVEGGCLIERQGVDVRQADLAQVRDTPETEAVHREFSHRIGLELQTEGGVR